MSDLINRQDAIDALLHNEEVYSNNFGDDPIDKYTVAIIDNDVQTLAQLPSAQPTVEIEPLTEDTIRIVVNMDTLKINRILLGEKETHWGGVFYVDDGTPLQPTPYAQPEIIRCKDCSRWCICHRSDEWYCADAERIKRG